MSRKINLNRWQLILAAVAVSLLGSLAARKNKQQRKLYEKELKQAPWAPPAWLFAPAWMLNNFFLLMGLQKLLQQEDIPSQQKLLIFQACIWLIFFSFGYVYFKKKSPLLAATWTIADAALATGSFIISNKENKYLSYTYLPLVVWTSYASTVAVYQALKNPDSALNIHPLF